MNWVNFDRSPNVRRTIGQLQLRISLDDIADRILNFFSADVARMNIGELMSRETTSGVSSGFIRSEIAPVAKSREDIPFNRLVKLWL